MSIENKHERLRKNVPNVRLIFQQLIIMLNIFKTRFLFLVGLYNRLDQTKHYSTITRPVILI